MIVPPRPGPATEEASIKHTENVREQLFPGRAGGNPRVGPRRGLFSVSELLKRDLN